MREPCACVVYMRVNSYSRVGAIEQEDMVNSGARGTKDWNWNWNPGIEVDWYWCYILL
jgi:hypothetical protein